MAQRQKPEFDAATWTPDKPWPQGYYKPVPGMIVAQARVDRLAGGEGAGFRRFFWVLLGSASQVLGFAAFEAGRHGTFGLLHALARNLTPWALLPLFVLVLPSLLYAAIVPKSATPFRRSFGYGLFWSLALLGLLVCVALLRPLLHVLFNFAAMALAQ